MVGSPHQKLHMGTAMPHFSDLIRLEKKEQSPQIIALVCMYIYIYQSLLYILMCVDVYLYIYIYIYTVYIYIYTHTVYTMLF